MKIKHTALAVSVSTALALANVSAFAAVNFGFSPSVAPDQSPIYAAEQPGVETVSSAYNIANRLIVHFPAVPGYTVNASNPMFIKVALTSGAKFSDISKLHLVCQKDGVGITTAAAQEVNSSQITFSLSTGIKLATAEANTGCSIFQVSGATASNGTPYFKLSNNSDQTMSALVEFKEGLANNTTAYVGKFITFKQALKVTASTTSNTAANAVIDVRESSQKFTSNNANGVVANETKAYVGTVKYASAITTNGPYFKQTSGLVDVTNVISTATITIAGVPVAAAQQFSIVSAAKDCNATVIDTVTPSGGTVTFTKVTPANIKAGINICMEISGTTAIDAGQLTVTVDGTAQTNWSPLFGESLKIHNLEKNGSSFRVLNVPASSLGDKAYIRLYNPNNFQTIVRGTMYDESGAEIGTSQVVATLSANQVEILNAETLEALFGTWTKRARLILDAEAENFKVQATMRTRSGILMNMSSESTD